MIIGNVLIENANRVVSLSPISVTKRGNAVEWTKRRFDAKGCG